LYKFLGTRRTYFDEGYTTERSLLVGLGLELDLVSGWLVVMHAYHTLAQ